jgi:SEC-C motif
MLFLSDAILESKERLIHEVESGTGDREKALRQILDLDSDDHTALVMLAQLRGASGDSKGAEELLWRAAQAQPCAWAPFMQLSIVLADQEALSKGLSELACRKMLLDEDAMEAMEDGLPDFDFGDIPELKEASTADKLLIMAGSLRELRDLEPLAVTARLRPHRLIQQLVDAETVDRQLVDALIQEGTAVASLLTGVLRGWVQNLIPDDDVFLVECSLAILGEIGEVRAIPDLLELSTLEDDEVAGPAGWALDRIVAQRPEEAARVMGEIAPELDGVARLSTMERIVRNRKMDPDGTLTERLFERFDRVDKEVRDHCFQALVSGMIALWGRAGIETARSLLRRHASLLSRDARRASDELIEEFSSLARPPVPSPDPSPWTVYDICDGEVDWEAERESEEEDEEEYFPSEPLRRKAIPERNDPCWCGSGRKYKKCHLEADERAEREAAGPASGNQKTIDAEFDSLRRKVGELLRTLSENESRTAITEFFGPESMDQDMGAALLLDWMVHDRISDKFGRTVLEEYLSRNADRLTQPERKFLESSARSYVDLFEVRELDPGVSMEVRSLTSGENSFVYETGMSKKLSRWDGLLARMIDGERGLEFSGPGSQIPRDQLEPLRSWMEEDRRRTGLSWPVYLKRQWPRICAQRKVIAEEWMQSFRLTNGDGDELVLTLAFYRVANRGALIASLRSAIDIDESEEGTSFVWLGGPASEEGRTVLGSMRVVGGELTLECNSRERLERGKKMLAELAGSAVEFQKEEITAQEELKRGVMVSPPSARPSRDKDSRDKVLAEVERPVVGEYLERHYAKWPDMKLPALDGKTPRQAVKNAAGKRKVAELLKQLENGEQRKRKAGEYAYDVSRLRRELGIKG